MQSINPVNPMAFNQGEQSDKINVNRLWRFPSILICPSLTR